MAGSNFVICSGVSFFLISSLFFFDPRSAHNEIKEELENL